MKLLITGGSGFIGINFILHILKKYPQYQVINLDKLTYASNQKALEHLEEHENYRFIQGDICDEVLVNQIVGTVDIIVHFAAETHVDRSITDASAFIKTNVLGTFNLLNAAKSNGNIRFHHISTDEVYGSLELESKELFSEKTPYDPRSPYSASKASSDHLVRSFFHTHNLPITISNCSNNYGPYQNPEKLIPFFITNLIEGKKVTLYGDGLNVRDWLHVKDHCEAIDLIIHKGTIGETYCIGGNCELKNIEVTKEILSHFSFTENMISYVKDRKGHDRRYAIDSSKISSELGWKPKHTFKEGIKETVKWYKKNPSLWKREDELKK